MKKELKHTDTDIFSCPACKENDRLEKLNTTPISPEKKVEWDLENLSSRLHQVYQKELERQGKKSKYDDFYSNLSEPIKDLDRALAKYIIEFIIPNAILQEKARWIEEGKKSRDQEVWEATSKLQ